MKKQDDLDMERIDALTPTGWAPITIEMLRRDVTVLAYVGHFKKVPGRGPRQGWCAIRTIGDGNGAEAFDLPSRDDAKRAAEELVNKLYKAAVDQAFGGPDVGAP